MRKINLFEHLPDASVQERFETLAGSNGVRIERIVSRGQCSPKSFWYDQETNEWVMLLEGRAALEFEGQGELMELYPGDALDIPAHRRHRLAWTSATETTVCLAVHY